MNEKTMAALRASAMTTLNKGADLAFKTTVVVLTLKFLGILAQEHKMTQETKTLFSVTGATKNENGEIQLEFDLSDEFVEMFKRDNNLKRWSEKKFNEWVTANIDTIIAATGIGPQLAAFAAESPETEEE